ncbi:hypothetical protein MUN81_12775 [Hymenobacter sp. 5317J-9]|uniref:hypothetical protein n=1 Tax=Hymenobacter sp. 5317J-9 TaxID=2932250 RepID=UPI001FD63A40|nr:hypothetical protein [Hymenobacter sp. 5317J-9]UOQ96128.1 hypothetical protein MUN81_12775 [Hymenobacter sp. 5317J-9]
MKTDKLLLGLSLMLLGFNAEAQKTLVNKKQKAAPASDFAVLPYRNSNWEMMGFEKDVKQASLNQDELNKVNLFLVRAAQDNKLKVYKRQYVCVIDQKGDKLVWVNCFCQAYDNEWRTKLFLVDDGGNCYYSFIVNLTTGKYYNLLVNGEA